MTIDPEASDSIDPLTRRYDLTHPQGDGKDVGLDLTGGWYDAGDHVKFNFPMAWSTTTLVWGLLEYRDAWQKSGELQNGLDCVKWPLDYLIKCHPNEDTYYVQVM